MAVSRFRMCTVFLIGVAGTVSGDCLKLPEIRNSGNNMSDVSVYREDTAVEFHCLPAYRPEGNNIFKCSGGKWIGGPFSCSPRVCPPLGSPDHGKQIGDNYEVGAVVRFKCDKGYELAGSSTYQCQSNEKWQPLSIPKCHIKKCGTAPSVAHGNIIIDHTVNGQNDVYGVQLNVQCIGNFIRSGPPKMYCDKNGRWTEKPKCEPVLCPPYPGLDSECVLKSKLEAENTLLFIYCTENSTPKGSRTASCVNNEWDDLSVGCLCDCAVKTTSDLVQLENLKSNGLLTHGETLKWHCKQGSINATTETLTCDNGAIGTPVCKANRTDTENMELAATESMEQTAIAGSGNIVIIAVVVSVIVLVCIIAGLLVFVFRKYLRCRGSNTRTNLLTIKTDVEIDRSLLRREQENKDDQEKCFDNEDIEEKTRTSLIHKEILLKGETNDHQNFQPAVGNTVKEFKKKTKAELKETDERLSTAISNEFRDVSKSKVIDLRDSSHPHKDTNKKERKAPGMTESKIKDKPLSEGVEHVSDPSLPLPSLFNNEIVLQKPFTHQNDESSPRFNQAKEKNEHQNSGTISKNVDLSTEKHMDNDKSRPKDTVQPNLHSKEHILACGAFDVSSKDSTLQERNPLFKISTRNFHCYTTLASKAENMADEGKFTSGFDLDNGTEID